MNLNKNNINYDTWLELLAEIEKHRLASNAPVEMIEHFHESQKNKTKHLCKINCKVNLHPTLMYLMKKKDQEGELFVCFNFSCAPISVSEGKQIAANILNDYGREMANEIIFEREIKCKTMS